MSRGGRGRARFGLDRRRASQAAWITYKSREHRDEVNAKVMGDPRMDELMHSEPVPFDGERMFFGGFAPLVQG